MQSKKKFLKMEIGWERIKNAKKSQKIAFIVLFLIGIPLAIYSHYNSREIVFFIKKVSIESDIKRGAYKKPDKEQISRITYYYKEIDPKLIYKAINDADDFKIKCRLIDESACTNRKDMLPVIQDILTRGYEPSLDSVTNRNVLFRAMLAEESLSNNYRQDELYYYCRDYRDEVIKVGKDKEIFKQPGELDLVALREIAKEILQKLKTKDNK